MTEGFDTTVPSSARVWNYLLGGTDNFPVDRAFLGRAVRYLAAEAGVRQFLDIGSGLPTMDNTHEVAQRVAPDARVVYVDNDPMVRDHAQALLTSTREGTCAYVQADLREPETILTRAAALDFEQPIAIMLLGILHFVLGTDEAAATVGG
jgi:hypothetical protein